MRLISTLRYTSDSRSGFLAGTGNHGGDLRLFFSTLNPADWEKGPGQEPILWKGGLVTEDQYNLPTGDIITLKLSVLTEPAGYVYVFGTIDVKTASGIAFGGGQPIGQGAGTFLPQKSEISTLKGRVPDGASGGLHFDLGFELSVPWDGVSADCHGNWWAVWH
jgi:hypothetical protein